jgi:O-antigen/teichoic acid export membrane protein
LWNLTNGLAAALQSVNVLGAVAIIRGLVVPMAQVGALWAAWKRGASTHTTLLLLLGVSALALVLVTILYARRLPLGQTVAAALRPRYARAGLRYGLGLLVPSLLWTLGGKLDLYVLGSRVEPALVGVYAACLQVASLLPNTRTLFDPVVQAQVGALHGRGDGELGASLQRLARLCALALGPAFVLLISVGGPILAYLLGHPVPRAALPLAILCAGQLIGSIAVASWLVPMSMPGRLLTIIAGTTLVVKLGLLLLLVPRWALVGAAVATAAGTIIAQQGQALLGGRGLGIRIYPRSLAVVLLAIGAIGAGGRLTYVMLAARLSGPVAAAAAGAGSVLLFIACLPALLEPSERAELAALLGRK